MINLTHKGGLQLLQVEYSDSMNRTISWEGCIDFSQVEIVIIIKKLDEFLDCLNILSALKNQKGTAIIVFAWLLKKKYLVKSHLFILLS